jgi:hypothetical protein
VLLVCVLYRLYSYVIYCGFAAMPGSGDYVNSMHLPACKGVRGGTVGSGRVGLLACLPDQDACRRVEGCLQWAWALLA